MGAAQQARDEGFASAFAPHPDIPQSTDEIIALTRAPIRILARDDKMRTITRLFRWEGRYRTIRHFFIIVAILNGAAFAFDACAGVEPPILLARLVISGGCLASTLLLLQLRAQSVESVCVAAPLLVCLALAGLVPTLSNHAFDGRYLDQALFVVGAGLGLLVFDFLHMVALTAATGLVLIAAVLLAPGYPLIAKAQDIVFYITAFAAILNARRISIRYRHRNILHYFVCELQRRKLADLSKQLNAVAMTDQLTGVGNRRAFHATLDGLASNKPIAVLMVDIDHFKVFNDTLGHAGGDSCLIAVARIIERRCGDGVSVTRFGGEEFVVLASDTSLVPGLRLAEMIRADIQAATISAACPVTVSIGVSAGPREAAERLLEEADAALYRAKSGGRNRVCATEQIAVSRAA